jgi:hypothetical protein
MYGGQNADAFLLGAPTWWTYSKDKMIVGPAASLKVNFGGGDGDDHLYFRFLGTLGGSLDLQADLGANNDTTDVEMVLSSTSTGSLTSYVTGADGDDFFEYFVSGGYLTKLDAVVNGGFGTNTCFHTENVKALFCV